jgi:hypothetical protein
MQVKSDKTRPHVSEREFHAALCAILALAATFVFIALGLIPSFGLIPR